MRVYKLVRANSTVALIDDDVEIQTEFIGSFNTITVLDPRWRVKWTETARKRKMKKIAEKAPSRSKNITNGEILEC